MADKVFVLPDLGEGLTEGEVLQWMVAVGDQVRLNQPIVEVETAKAAVEVPSPYAGTVVSLGCAAGEVLDVGAPLITIDTAAGAPSPAAEGAAANPVESAATQAETGVGSRTELLADKVPAAATGTLIGETGANGRTATLVGYGPRSGSVTRRPRKDPAARAAEPEQPREAPVEAVAEPPQPSAVPVEAAARTSAAAVGRSAERSAQVSVLAKPPVRKHAKDLGVDLATLSGTGPGGAVTRQDVDQAASEPAGDVGEGDATPRDAEAGPVARLVAPIEDERIAVRGVRKATAEAMVASAFTAPHVTEFLTLDMTASMELVARLRQLPDFADVRVSPLLLVARALLLALRRHPLVNSSFQGEEIVVRRQVNLGIAAATPRGLLVPNIKDAGALSLVELAGALQQLTNTAREGRTAPADLARGTVTITNVGVFGVDTGTPILNPGEAAILCFGAVRPTPWVHEGQVAIRQVTQLALSFDHRVIDGQLGSQFLSDVGRMLSDPAIALAWS